MPPDNHPLIPAGTAYRRIVARQVGVNGVDPAVEEEPVDEERRRGKAYVAIAAHIAGDRQLVSDSVYDLTRSPVEAAGAVIVLIIACGALAELWGRAIHEEPTKAWAMYAAAVARGSANSIGKPTSPEPER